MTKKNSLILISIYLIVGTICTALSYQSFTTAFSTYNIFQQQEELRYYEYGKILITKPNLSDSEKKEYNTLKVVAEATTFLKNVNANISIPSLFAKGFGYSLPFVLVLYLICHKSRIAKISSALIFVYLCVSINYHNQMDNAENVITRYFEEISAREHQRWIDKITN